MSDEDDLLDLDGTEGVYVELDHVGSGRIRRSTTGAIAQRAGLRDAEVSLTGAQLAQLFSAPPEIVAAPGVGKILQIVSYSIEWVPGATAPGWNFYAPFYDDGNAPTILGNRAAPPAPGFARADLPYAAQIAIGAGGFENFTPSPQPPLLRSQFENTAIVLSAQDNITDDLTSDSVILDGKIVSVDPTPATAGTGYAVGDTGTLGGAPVVAYPGTATYRVDAVNGGGGVTAFHMTHLGDGGYDATPGDQPGDAINGGSQPGSGSGFQITITAISPPDGDFHVSTLYRVIDLH